MSQRSLLCLILIMLSGELFAQQDYFVLIQSVNKQPFYARVGDRTFNCSDHGYVIIPKLTDTAYSIKIGFPRQGVPEVSFSVNLHKKDQSYLLKDMGDKGLELFNPQTSELISQDVSEKKEEVAEQPKPMGMKKDDAFSRMMAGVVGDTAVMYNTYAVETVAKDTAVSVKTEAVTNAGNTTQLTDTAIVTVASTPAAPLGDTTKNAGAVAMTGAQTADSAHTSAVNPPGEGMLVHADTVHTMIDTARVTGMVASDTAINSIRGHDSVGKVALSGDPMKGGTVVKSDTMMRDTALATVGIAGVSPVNGSTGMAASSANQGIKAMDSLRKDSINKDWASSKAAVKDTVLNSGVTLGAPLHEQGVVRKIGERKTVKSVRLVYSDHVAGQKADTIVVIIPVDTVARQAAQPVAAVQEGVVDSGMVRSGGKTPAPAVTPAAVEPLYRPKSDSSQKKAAKIMLVNSDCRAFASDYDVDKLRVKMLAADKDEDRIAEAKKVFRVKCFTTKQIGALSEVFGTDVQKYKFFEVAYPYVSDDRYKELSDLLADPVFNGKFKAMVGGR